MVSVKTHRERIAVIQSHLNDLSSEDFVAGEIFLSEFFWLSGENEFWEVTVNVSRPNEEGEWAYRNERYLVVFELDGSIKALEFIKSPILQIVRIVED